ncbi:GNAT family N-acetyltransferase [Streptomyces coeruleoprunus]|uniref:GNAT family N-acetyltransferase n=1 Tax=Streptomyces coeruleoprunus TaxID=285563 RepID=A0ABV9X933_9ACTN
MTEADCEAVSEVRVSGWRFAYRGLLPHWYLSAMDVAADAAARREHLARSDGRTVDLVAERAGSVVGWACFGPDRFEGAAPDGAELYALYVRPEVVGTGVGRALMAEVTARAEARGYREMALWVLKDNALGRRFYEKAGFAPDGVEEPWHVAGVTLVEIRCTRPLTRPLTPPAGR